MQHLPMGTVTLLFTDIEGSTRLLQQLGNRYAEVLMEYWHVLRQDVSAPISPLELFTYECAGNAIRVQLGEETFLAA